MPKKKPKTPKAPKKRWETLRNQYEVLDDKLFGNIHNDPNLQGSTIQGMDMMRSLKYLNLFIEDMEQGRYRIPGLSEKEHKEYADSLLPLREKLYLAIMIKYKITTFLDDNKNVEQKERELAFASFVIEMRDLFLKFLRENQSILIPGGWIGPNQTTGHAILYEFKIEEGNLVFLIHNTGSGLEKHAKRELAKRQYYSTVKSYKMSLQGAFQKDLEKFGERFKDFISELLKPQIMPAFDWSRINASDLYQDIDTKGRDLGLTETDPSPYTKGWSRDQLSGTCAFRVFESYLANYPFSKPFDDLQYEIFRKSLIEYYLMNKEDLTDATLQRQMNFALQNFARLIQDLSERVPPVLSKERITDGINLLQEIQHALNRARLKPLPSRILPQSITEEFLTAPDKEKKREEKKVKELRFDVSKLDGKLIYNSRVAANFNESTFKESKVDLTSLPPWDESEPSKSLKSLVEFLERCQKNKDAHALGLVIQDIENLDIPLYSESWSKLGNDELEIAYDTFYKLQKLYNYCLATTDPRPYFERPVTLIRLSLLAFNVFQALHKNNQSLVNKMAGKILWEIKISYKELQESPYFTAFDKKNSVKSLGEAIDKMIPYWSIDYNSENKEKSEFQVLISNMHPDEKKMMLNLCNIVIKFRQKQLVGTFDMKSGFSKRIYDIVKDLSPEKLPPNLDKASDEDKILYFAIHLCIYNRDHFVKEYPDLAEKLRSTLKLSEMSVVNLQSVRGWIDSTTGDKDPLEYFSEKHLRLEKTETGTMQCVVQDPVLSQSKTRTVYKFPTTQSKISDAEMEKIFIERPKSSNVIQIETATRSLNAKNSFLRLLKNIRLKPSTQIVQTIDLMKRSFSKLSESNIQTFILLNLFDANLLEQQLSYKSAQCLDDILQIIDRGMETYTGKKEMKSEVIFFLKMSIYLLDRLPKDQTFDAARDKLTKFINRIPEYIEQIEKRLATTPLNPASEEANLSLLMQLHNLNIIYMKNKLEESPTRKLSILQITQMLTSIFYVKNSPEILNDPHLKHLRESSINAAQRKLQQSLQDVRERSMASFEEILDALLSKQDFKRGDIEANWLGEYPVFTLTSAKDKKPMVSLNLLTGHIITQTAERVLLPEEFYENSVFRDYFKTKIIHGNLSPDKNVFQFNLDKQNYRFILQPIIGFNKYDGALQQEINMDGVPQWFEFYPEGNRSNYPEIPLPLLDQKFRIWSSVDTQYPKRTLIVDKTTGKILYRLEDDVAFELNLDGTKTGFYLLNNNSIEELLKNFPALASFESTDFMIVSKSDILHQIRIELPRYGISFKATILEDGSIGDLIYQNDPRYKLKVDSDFEFVPDFNAALWLVSASGARIPEKVMMPARLFKATEDQEGEYHRLTFDKGYEIMSEVLRNTNKLKAESVTKTNWANTERLMHYTVTDTLQLKPDSTQSELYLAYLYLAKRQPLLAFDILTKLSRETDTLNENDIAILRDIIREIPARLRGYSTDTEDKARIDTPEFVAVRMQAYFLLAKQKASSQVLRISEMAMTDTSMHSEYQAFRREDLKNFWKNKNLSAAMLDSLKEYIEKRQFVPGQLLLDENQELEMLRYIMFYQKKLPPNIQYRRRELELKVLVRERDRLISLKTEVGELSPILTEHLNALNERISHYPTVRTLEPDLTAIGGLGAAAIPVQIPVPIPLLKEKALKKPNPVQGKNILLLEQANFGHIYEQSQKVLEKGVNFKKKSQALFDTKEKRHGLAATLYQETLDEYQHGLQNNLKLKAREEAAKKYYELNLAKEGGEALFRKVSIEILHDKKTLEALKREILKFANQEPSDPAKKGEWALKKLALQVEDLSFEQILHLYLKRDSSLYAAKTALTEREMQILQQKVFDYLVKATETQYLERVQAELAILQDKKQSKEAIEAATLQLGMLLSMKRCYRPAEQPEILLFEYLENKLIYPEQYHYLKTLMERQKGGGFTSQIIKLIMGGGKSKVLLPLLALEKATGSNLVVMEVPEALFEINKADLNATTMRLFGCEAHPFHFDESVRCNSRYLLNLKRELKKVVRNREYLVTTKESLQAFELKYLKLLRYGDLKQKATRNELKHLADILKIFRSQGDFLIDEVDSTLDIRKQLIYTVGKSRRINPDIAVAGYDFFQYLDSLKIDLTKLGKKESITLKQIITHEKTPTGTEWKVIIENFAMALIEDENSPLQKNMGSDFKMALMQDKKFMAAMAMAKDEREIEAYFATVKKTFQDYLLGRTKVVPEFISALPGAKKELLGFYKLELESLLVRTLSKKKDVNFGKSLDPNKAPELQDIAIPYAATAPNEKSRFKNPMETLNYTLLLHYREPVSLNTFKRLLAQFKAEQEEEERQGIEGCKEGAAARFKALTSFAVGEEEKFKSLAGDNLKDIDINDALLVNTLYMKLCDKPSIRRFAMTKLVLANIDENEEYLASNAHNHCSQARSIQGMTGTDWNKRCLPKTINTEQALEGSDGQVIDYLLRNAHPPHLLKEAAEGIEQAMSIALKLFDENPNRSHFHAWIDLGAHFRGIANRTVAERFAKYFNINEEFKLIKYVLYFNPDGKFYAVPKSGGAPLYLEETSPEYLKARLGVGPEEYFVYYDQRRTTGTDIKQTATARAFVSLSADTLKRDLLQAVMRLRDLRNKQEVEFVIPTECQDTHPQIKQWNVSTVIQMCQENEVARLAEDHFRAAIQEMNDRVRSELLNRIFLGEDIPRKQSLIQKFHNVFFSRIETSLFALYGRVNETRKVAELLREQMETLMKTYRSMLIDADIVISLQEEVAMRLSLERIVQATIPICPETIEQKSNKVFGSEFEAEVQLETTETTETTEEQEESYAAISDISPAEERNLTKIPFLLGEMEKLGIISIEEMAKSADVVPLKQKKGASLIKPRTWQFSPDLKASYSFAHSVNAQANLMDSHQKEGGFVLVQYDPGIQDLVFVLITPEEADVLSESIKDYEKLVEGTDLRTRYWIETSRNTLLYGEKPAPEKLPKKYHELMDELHYFNDDQDLLYRDLGQNSFLAKQSEEKLQYLQQRIAPQHLDKPNLVKPLRDRAKDLFGLQRGLLFGTGLDLQAGLPPPEPKPKRPSKPAA